MQNSTQNMGEKDPEKSPVTANFTPAPREKLNIERPKWAPSRTGTFIFMALCVFTLFVIICIMGADLARLSRALCTSEECTTAAGEILEAADLKSDPCDDFHHYACAEWLERHTVPEGQDFEGQLQENKNQIKAFFAEELKFRIHNQSPKPWYIAKKYFDSCMNKDERNKQQFKPVKEFFKNKLGSSNIIKSGATKDEVSEVIAKLLASNINTLMDMEVVRNPVNGDPSLLLKPAQPNVYLNQATEKEFRFYTSMFDDYGEEVGMTPVSGIARFIAKLTNIQMKYAGQTLNPEDYKDGQTNVTIQEEYPFMKWTPFFHTLFEKETPPDRPFTLLAFPEYWKDITLLIEEVNGGTYWSSILALAMIKTLPHLNLEATSIDDTLNPPSFESNLEDECIENMMRDVRFPLENLYVERKLGKDSESKQEILDMAESVRAAFLQNVENVYESEWMEERMREKILEMAMTVKMSHLKNMMESDWMENKVRERVRSKVLNMHFYVGWPQRSTNETWMEDNYNSLSITEENYFKNLITMSEANVAQEINCIINNDPVPVFKYPTYIPRAYYSHAGNYFVINAGMLMPPFYYKGAPKYVLYGSLGLIIAHELSHAFDTTGVKYDNEGRYIGERVKGLEREKKLGEKAKCLIEQYEEMSGTTSLDGKVVKVD